MRHVLKPLAVALCGAFLSFAVTAKTFDQAGAAPSELQPVGTYAAGSPVRSSLKTLVPKDWQIMVHRGVQLPATMDWSATDTWPQVLANFAESNGFSVLVDWDKHSVFIRPTSVALEDSVRRAQVSQAASTPLPSTEIAQPQHAVPALLKNAQPPVAAVDKATVDALTTKLASLEGELTKLADAKSKGQEATTAALDSLRKELDARGAALTTAQQELVAARQSADEARQLADAAKASAAEAKTSAVTAARESAEASAQAALAAKPVVVAAAVPAPAPAPVAATVTAAAQGFALPTAAPTEYQSLTIGQGFNRSPVHVVASKVAEIHGAALDFQAPADLAFPGPVTILGADLGEDVRLMLGALGPDTQVSFDICRKPAYLRVVPAIAGSGKKFSESACSHPALHLAAAQPRALPIVAPASASQVAAVHVDTAAPVAAAVAFPSVLPTTSPTTVATVATVAPAIAAQPAAVGDKPAAFAFSLSGGADLESGLREFFKANGYALKWDSEFEFNAADPLNASGKDLVEVLMQFLPRMGLEAEINTQERIVRVGDKRNEVKN